MENDDIKDLWKIALSGIQRFFDEGMFKWSKEQFYKLFPSKEIAENDYIKMQLTLLDKEGKIKIKNEEDLYFIVVNI
jgi:hypothetical protein